MRFLLVWAVGLFEFFSVSQAKRNEYLPGIYPALALLVGYLGDKAIHFWQEKYYLIHSDNLPPGNWQI